MQFPARPLRSLALSGLLVCLGGLTRVEAQLPAPPAPPENPITPSKAVLGKILFWDEQLSSDNTVACGTCHIPAAGGSDARTGEVLRNPGADGLMHTGDDVFGSPGVVNWDADDELDPDPIFGLGQQTTGRHSPTFLTGAFFRRNFWDGRAGDQFLDPETGAVAIQTGGALESQAAGPPVNDVEMAHEVRSWSEITAKLARVKPLHLARNLPPDVRTALALRPTYPALFQAAFGSPDITARRIAFALATYERILVPNQSPFDEFMHGDINALTADQRAGFLVMEIQGECSSCHELFPTPGQLLNPFRNTGVRPVSEDIGLQAVTGLPSDAGKFKVPLLWNIGLRERFFHNGSLTSLVDVVEFYDRGGDFFDNTDPLLRPLGLSTLEKAQLVDFLQNGLTDPRVAAELPPFDRPTLYSEVPVHETVLYGTGVAGTGGAVPQMLVLTPTAGYTPGFKIGLAQGLGGAQAFLVVTLHARNFGPGSGPVANGAGGTRSSSIVVGPRTAGTLLLDGAGAGAGYGTLVLDPPPPMSQVHAQWWVVDPGAAGGFAKSEFAELVFF